MSEETVVLIHGLWVNGMDMSLLKYRLGQAGYETAQFSYNSVRHSPLENAVELNAFAKSIAADRVHFVCHSLGGILIRHLFHEYPQQGPGRVVTLGTPHTHSSAARQLARFFAGEFILGKSTERGLLGRAPPWDGRHELGSIAGNFRLGLGMFMPGIPAPNDGTVAVEETRLDGMKAHCVLNASHFGLLLSKQAADHTIDFLHTGCFSCA